MRKSHTQRPEKNNVSAEIVVIGDRELGIFRTFFSKKTSIERDVLRRKITGRTSFNFGSFNLVSINLQADGLEEEELLSGFRGFRTFSMGVLKNRSF